MPSLADSDVVSSLPCFSGACPPPRVESAASMRGELGLGEGRSNHNFIVTTSDGRRFFVRLGDDLPAFGVSRAHEHAAAQAAAAAGVGPVVIFASLHHCALVFELIEGGKALTEEEIRSATSSEGGKALTEEEIRSATSSDQDDTSADDQSAGDQSVDERHGECNCQPRSEGGTDARSLSKSLSKRSSSLLESIAAILVRLHRTPPPLALLEDSDAAADASSSSATTLGTPSGGGREGEGDWTPHALSEWISLAKSSGYSRLPVLDTIDETLSRLKCALGPCPEGAHSFCHFDLLADNFVVDGRGTLYLVDFEYASAGQPLFDLAVMAAGANLGREEASRIQSIPSPPPPPHTSDPPYIHHQMVRNLLDLRSPGSEATRGLYPRGRRAAARGR